MSLFSTANEGQEFDLHMNNIQKTIEFVTELTNWQTKRPTKSCLISKKKEKSAAWIWEGLGRGERGKKAKALGRVWKAGVSTPARGRAGGRPVAKGIGR